MQTKLSLLCERVIEAGWLAVLILVPIFFNIYSARSFEPDKLTLMRSIALVMALAWLIKIAETGIGHSVDETSDAAPPKKARLGIGKLLNVPLFLPTLLLVLSYVISTLFSISPKVALWGSYQRLQGTYTALSYIVIFALMATHLHTRAQLDRLVTTVILTSLPVALYGVIQHYGLDPLPWAGDVTRRVASNLGNAIFVASYLIMAIPLTLARLFNSMSAILNEEEASWGHTVLAAVYIFILAVELITVLFSKSRGPLLGLLAGLFFFVFLGLLTLYRQREVATSATTKDTLRILPSVAALLAGGVLVLKKPPRPVSVGQTDPVTRKTEVAPPITIGDGLRSLLEVIAILGLCGTLGMVWFRLAGPVSVGGATLDFWALIGTGISLGFAVNVLVILLLAAIRRGWSRLWLNWVILAVFMAGFLVSLNLPNSPFLAIRSLPTVGRLTQLFQAGAGSGRVRVLIWQGVLELTAPHEPLGIPGEFSDRYNVLRPLVGYGPESMFNAFAEVYPPELAHVEKRGSSADRSHNETFDFLAIMGVFGFLAYYFLMFSLFYYLLKAVGWIPDDAARKRLLALLGVGGLLGVVIPRLVAGDFVFSGLGLPASMLFMILVYLVWQALVQRDDEEDPGKPSIQLAGSREALLLLGVFMALVSHFVEVHFVFSIAATYVYFWAYAGLVVARMRWAADAKQSTALVDEDVNADDLEVEPQPPRRSRRKRRRRPRKPASLAAGSGTATAAVRNLGDEDWETWLGVSGLVGAIILIAMIFDFVTSQLDLSRGSFSMLWMFAITWGLGLAVGLGETAIRDQAWNKPIRWARAFVLYIVTSLGYSVLYLVIHRWQLKPRNISAADPTQAVIKGANVFGGALVVFYVFVGLLILLIAAMLALPLFRRQPFWRVANWWLYPVLILATGGVIMFKNVDVVRADMYLKQGEQYRNQRQYDNAIILHQRSIQFDRDEDFYYLMLALDYQLKGQDSRISGEERARAWSEGERIAVQAREINKYNPDNTGNLGRYYFTWAQMVPTNDPQGMGQFQKALEYFEKATKLAPQNVVYYNLWAQTYYILGQYEQAEKILQTSVTLDPEFEQTQMLLGDTYAALGRPTEAVTAHRAAILLAPNAFADQFLEQRLNFYVSASQQPSAQESTSPIELIISAFEEAGALSPDDPLIPRTLGRIYARMGDHQTAIAYYEQAISMGDNNVQTVLAVADTYLSLKDYENAASAYQLVLQSDPKNVQAHSNLGYVYAQLGRKDEAIEENLQVLQLSPDDYISHRNLVLLYRDSGLLDEAIQQAERMIEVTPPNELGTGYLLLGSLYEASGKPEEAISVYQQAVAAAPDLYQAQVALGNLYLQQGRLEDALPVFEAVAQLATDDYAVHQQLAIIYQQLGRYDEALAEAHQALNLAPEGMKESLQVLVAQIEGEKG
jgi:tetratricopeptide (TPR) repeat protein